MRGLAAFGLGAFGGALIGTGIWWFAARKLDASLAAGSEHLASSIGVGQNQLNAEFARGRQELRTQVAAMVQAQVPLAIDERMRVYGITPQLVRNVNQVLAYGERVGLL